MNTQNQQKVENQQISKKVSLQEQHSIQQRENRFSRSRDSAPNAHLNQKFRSLKEQREHNKKLREELQQTKNQESQLMIVQADYKTRGLDFCYYCGLKFNIGERIPRILVHCGHTFCTECLTQLHHNFRVRCPICRKLVKQIETVDKLPLNFNILYEIVEREPILKDLNFEDDGCVDCLLCEKHDQRVQHFFCSNHLTVFCRECIKEDHTDEKCFVVDLYEIEKMRKLHKQNQQMNSKQLNLRKDDATASYATLNIPKSEQLGDSKWLLKRKELLLEKKKQRQQQLLVQQQYQALLQQQYQNNIYENQIMIQDNFNINNQDMAGVIQNTKQLPFNIMNPFQNKADQQFVVNNPFQAQGNIKNPIQFGSRIQYQTQIVSYEQLKTTQYLLAQYPEQMHLIAQANLKKRQTQEPIISDKKEKQSSEQEDSNEYGEYDDEQAEDQYGDSDEQYGSVQDIQELEVNDKNEKINHSKDVEVNSNQVEYVSQDDDDLDHHEVSNQLNSKNIIQQKILNGGN